MCTAYCIHLILGNNVILGYLKHSFEVNVYKQKVKMYGSFCSIPAGNQYTTERTPLIGDQIDLCLKIKSIG